MRRNINSYVMPEPPADLVVYYYGGEERSQIADKIVSECGFHPSDTSDSVVVTDDYTAYHYQPFEVRDENLDLLEKSVEQLQQRFPEMDVWTENNYQKDHGTPVGEHYQIYIAATRGEVEDNQWEV
ncbi:hypothetical protein [Salinigranum marinum]|uniref:hypothetical protein n=1 Tax=Salinigranum marinum TaxID=1515595 RepID=UPI002989E2ED|nr:hypothetical protein [Salinigranum marinum]